MQGASLILRAALLSLILLPICLSRPATAQIAPAPDAPPSAGPSLHRSPAGNPSQNGPNSFPEPMPAFRVTSNLVTLDFVVRGPHGKLVTGLTHQNCSVEEDGVRQTWENFSAAGDQPLSLGILLDTSLSQQDVLPREQRTADDFLHRILRPHDEAFLFSFDVDVSMLSDFTRSTDRLTLAMDRAHINSYSGNFAVGTIPSIGKPKGTVLYDAVVLAANDKLRHAAGRKAIILLTDGVDEGSDETLKSAIEAAQRANAVVDVLLIRAAGGMFDDAGSRPMRKLADATGGRVFPIGNDRHKMQAAFQEIEQELRSQYQGAYAPTNKRRDGTYRRIQVDCQKNGQRLHVQARRGYYAASQ